MTNNQRQEITNNACELAFNDAMEEFRESNKFCGRLRHCSAYVYETDNFYILLSYNTYIACIDKRDDCLYDVLRTEYGYTSTSAQHISKFSKDYGRGKWGCTFKYTAR